MIVVAAGVGTSSLIWVRWETVSIETALIWGAAAIVVLIVGRALRRRDRAGEAILSSVRAYARGTLATESLRVADDFGPLACAYNRLLDDRASMVTQALAGSLEAAGIKDHLKPQQLQSVLDTLWHGVVIVAADGSVSLVNGAARVILGLDEHDDTSRTADDLADDHEVVSAIRRIASGQSRSPACFECTRESEGITTYLRFSLRPRGGDEGGCVVIIEDTSGQHAADEARTSLMAHAVHELRTPLTNIRLYVEEALESDSDDTETRGRALNVINHEARRLERVVSDMLSAAEVESGSMSIQRGDVRLEQLFDELKEDYQAAADDKQIGLTFALPPKLPILTGDRDKLGLLLHNLIGNAIKYTPAGGAVVVRFEERDDAYVFEVADTGIGIDPEEAEQVFERFYRASDERVKNVTGTGLGLALAREVARLHGGDITLESRLDEGSTFTVTLPREARAAAA